MSLVDLPQDLILCIADLLPYYRDKISLSATSLRLYHALNRHIYRHNARYGQSTAFAWALSNGRVDTATKAIEEGAQAPHLLEHMILRLIKRGEKEIPRLLLKSFDQAHVIGKKKSTVPIFQAAKYGNTAIIGFLLRETCIDANEKNNHGKTALHLAVQNGVMDTLEYLLRDPRVDVNARDEKLRTPVFEIIGNTRGSGEILKRLLMDDRVIVDAKDENGDTPLAFLVAHFYSELEMVKLLLLHPSVDPDSKNNSGRTPLSLAKDNSVVRLLLENPNVDPNSKDNNGHTPLHWALQENLEKKVSALLSLKSQAEP